MCTTMCVLHTECTIVCTHYNVVSLHIPKLCLLSYYNINYNGTFLCDLIRINLIEI